MNFLKKQNKTIKKSDIFTLFEYFNKLDQNKITPALTVFLSENSKNFENFVKIIQSDIGTIDPENEKLLKEYNIKESNILKSYIKLDSKGIPITNNNQYIFKNEISEKEYKIQHEILDKEYADLHKILSEFTNRKTSILAETTEIEINVLPFDKLPQINIPFFIINIISDYDSLISIR